MLLRWSFVCAALTGSIFSAIWGWAAYRSQQNTPQSVEAAVRLVPYNAAYWARLAYLEPERGVEFRRKAVAFNSHDSQSLIQLGLHAELGENNPQLALQYYVQAARVDNAYLPKWTLTNFYFRQGNESEFFKWAKASLEITPNSADPIFDQLWSMSQDQDKIASAIPGRSDSLLKYASYLDRHDRWSALPSVVDRIIAETPLKPGMAPAGLSDIIGPAEDELLNKGHFDAGLHVWSSLSRAHWIDFGIPSPANPLTNRNFDHPFTQHGFDWNPTSGKGFSITSSPDQSEARVRLDGSQPESCLLLSQYVPLAGGHTYRLQWEASSKESESDSGIAWTLDWQEHTSQSTDVLTAHAWEFQVPAERNYGRLELRYRRNPGRTLTAEALTLRRVNLTER